jgi:hypothetical protein
VRPRRVGRSRHGCGRNLGHDTSFNLCASIGIQAGLLDVLDRTVAPAPPVTHTIVVVKDRATGLGVAQLLRHLKRALPLTAVVDDDAVAHIRAIHVGHDNVLGPSPRNHGAQAVGEQQQHRERPVSSHGHRGGRA